MSTPGIVSFGPSGSKGSVTVSIVENPEEQAKGLSGRNGLPPDSGMLFWFGLRADHGFWMKNTLLPLDLVFLDYDRVVGILTLQPFDLEVRRVGRLSTAVLETGAGWCASHGVVVGDKVTIFLT